MHKKAVAEVRTMKNLKDFLASALAFAIIGGMLGGIYVIASPAILIFVALFSLAWIFSVIFLAIYRMCETVRGLFPRKIPVPRPAVAGLSIQLD